MTPTYSHKQSKHGRAGEFADEDEKRADKVKLELPGNDPVTATTRWFGALIEPQWRR